MIRFFVAVAGVLCASIAAAHPPVDAPPQDLVCELPFHVRSSAGKEIEKLRREQRQLLLRLRAQIHAMPQSPRRTEYEQRLAEYEKQGECPVPDRSALSFATEVFDRIEDCGTRNFPQSGGEPLYGTARVTFLIAPDGTLLSNSIARSSGVPDIDKHALLVVSASAPFGKVPKSILDGRFKAVKVIAAFTFEHQASPSPDVRPKKKCTL